MFAQLHSCSHQWLLDGPCPSAHLGRNCTLHRSHCRGWGIKKERNPAHKDVAILWVRNMWRHSAELKQFFNNIAIIRWDRAAIEHKEEETEHLEHNKQLMVETNLLLRWLHSPHILLHLLRIEIVLVGWFSKPNSPERWNRPWIDQQTHRRSSSKVALQFPKTIKQVSKEHIRVDP